MLSMCFLILNLTWKKNVDKSLLVSIAILIVTAYYICLEPSFSRSLEDFFFLTVCKKNFLPYDTIRYVISSLTVEKQKKRQRQCPGHLFHPPFVCCHHFSKEKKRQEKFPPGSATFSR